MSEVKLVQGSWVSVLGELEVTRKEGDTDTARDPMSELMQDGAC
jgi:hypothetical protein